jgi:hypothetical protein
VAALAEQLCLVGITEVFRVLGQAANVVDFPRRLTLAALAHRALAEHELTPAAVAGNAEEFAVRFLAALAVVLPDAWPTLQLRRPVASWSHGHGGIPR